MNKKILWYTLGLNFVTSFLSALIYKWWCGAGETKCGIGNHLNIYIPVVLSGLIVILLAYFIAKWLKRPIVFFIVILLLLIGFNSPTEGFTMTYYFVGVPPAFIAALVAWFLGKEKKKEENPTPPVA